MLPQLGLRGFRPTAKEVVEVELSREANPPARKGGRHARELELHVPRGTAAGVFASISAERLPKREYQLVHVVERSKDRILGGISYAVVHSREGDKS